MGNRAFIPGSEWAYFKIYTGTKTADVILKNEVFGYVKEMLNSGIIDKWFFIRYTDPDFHIRLRLHLKDSKNFSSIFNSFFDCFLPVVDSDLVWNIQCDSYYREIERYGTNTISIIEDVFFIDSEFILRFIQRLDDGNPEQQRWKLALAIVDNYLTAFRLDLQQRKDIAKINADKFKNEFGLVHHNETKQLNDKYRAHRKDIENVMMSKDEILGPIIKEHMKAIALPIEKIIITEKSGKLQVSMISLLSSIIHMSLDRLFLTRNRLHEMVIYEFLSRYYASEIAKTTNNIRK